MIRVFNHYLPTSIIVLVAVEAAILLLSIYLGVSVRFLDPTVLTVSGAPPLLPMAIVFAAVMMTVMTAFGLYHWEFHEELSDTILRLGASFVVGLGILSFVFYLFPNLFLGRGVIGIVFISSLGGIVAVRLLFFKWADLEFLKPRILVLGSGTRAAQIDSIMRSGSGRHKMHIVGYLPLKSTSHSVHMSRLLPDTEPLPQIVDKYRIDEIVIAVRDRRGGGVPIDELLECKLRGIRVIELSSFFERETGQVQISSLNASWMVLSDGFRQGYMRDVVKRIFDISVSLVLLTVSAPVMLLTAIAILLESGHPVLYRQERVGQGGRTFMILKFRSMRVDAETGGAPQWASANDRRVTAVGRVIRKLRIDELPQIFNVLGGQMSFVGPRPERPYFVEQLTQRIPYYNSRHSVKPGITGWAQVRYPYGASVEDAIEKLQYDLYYVKNHSLFLDLMILANTAQVVLWGKGAR